MALVNIVASLTIEDGDGEIFAVPIYATASDASTIAAVVTAISALANIVDDVIDGRIVKAGFRLDVTFPVTGLKTEAVLGSEVERTGLYNFNATGTKYDAAIDLPAMSLDTLVAGTNQIDPTVAAVSTWISTATGGESPLTFTDKYGHALNSLKSARKTFRKHRRSTKLH